MVDEFRNYFNTDNSGKIELKQMTSLMQCAAKQVRISSSAFEEVKVQAHSASYGNNSTYTSDVGDRGIGDAIPGKTDVSGSIEIQQDSDIWFAIAMGCEVLVKTGGVLKYYSFPIAHINLDSTATTIVADDGTTITTAMLVAASATSGAGWVPTDTRAGKMFLPSDFPIFDMKVTLDPGTDSEQVSYYKNVHFEDIKENSGRSVKTYTINYKAEYRMMVTPAVGKGR